MFDAPREGEINEAIVPEETLSDYVLNMSHPQGRDKAVLFRDLLGIGREDWKYLATQIVEGLRGERNVRRVRQTEYGVQYHVDLPILGRNGQAKTVRTAWLATGDSAVRLTTALVAPEGHQLDDAPVTLVLAGNLEGQERWEALFRLASTAGAAAAAEIVPRPMVVTNGETKELIPDDPGA